jgi:hypothetical protein
VDHRVDDLAVAGPGTPARLGQEVGHIGHRFHPAGHNRVKLSGADHQVRVADCGQARQAHVVERDRWDFLRDPGCDCCLTGGDLAGAGLQDVPDHHVAGLRRCDPGPGDRLPDRDST